LELTIGPFRSGASSGLAAGATDEVDSALRLLSDELDVSRDDGSELLRIVMLDHGPQTPGFAEP
jgi:hypothetical protein